MKVVDVIKIASVLTSDQKMQEVIDKITLNTQSLTSEEERLAQFYLSSFNLAVKTIASEDLGVFEIEKLVSDDGCKINYDRFGEEVFSIKEVVDKRLDARVEFFALPFSLYVPMANREYLVKYAYLPKKPSSLQEEVAFPPYWTAKLVAYLMASDIFLSKALYDEHSYYKNEYIKTLKKVVSKKASARVLASRPLM